MSIKINGTVLFFFLCPFVSLIFPIFHISKIILIHHFPKHKGPGIPLNARTLLKILLFLFSKLLHELSIRVYLPYFLII